MTWNWPLAAVVMALLLFGYCTYAAHESGRSLEHVVDKSATAQHCYSAGYDAGASGSNAQSGGQDEDCARWFNAGYSDGRRVYNALTQ